jgi:hypothetical protein
LREGKGVSKEQRGEKNSSLPSWPQGRRPGTAQLLGVFFRWVFFMGFRGLRVSTWVFRKFWNVFRGWSAARPGSREPGQIFKTLAYFRDLSVGLSR